MAYRLSQPRPSEFAKLQTAALSGKDDEAEDLLVITMRLTSYKTSLKAVASGDKDEEAILRKQQNKTIRIYTSSPVAKKQQTTRQLKGTKKTANIETQ